MVELAPDGKIVDFQTLGNYEKIILLLQKQKF